jgi:hypothetical protein
MVAIIILAYILQKCKYDDGDMMPIIFIEHQEDPILQEVYQEDPILQEVYQEDPVLQEVYQEDPVLQEVYPVRPLFIEENYTINIKIFSDIFIIKSM